MGGWGDGVLARGDGVTDRVKSSNNAVNKPRPPIKAATKKSKRRGVFIIRRHYTLFSPFDKRQG